MVDSLSSNTKWIRVWTVMADYHIGSPRVQALLLLLAQLLGVITEGHQVAVRKTLKYE